MNSHFTQHALSRVRQRGLREADIDVIVDAGTPVDSESVLLLNHDVDREIRKRKREIAMFERLRGCRVVLAGAEKIVTVYRPSRKTEKQLLRGTHRYKHTDNADSNYSFPPFNGDYSHVR